MSNILIFTDYYLPGFKAGGPITTIENLTNTLNDTYSFSIITRNYDLGEKNKPYEGLAQTRWYEKNKTKIRYLPDENITLKEIKKLLLENRFEVIYLNSFFSEFTIKILLLAKFNISIKEKIIIAPRGELHANALSYKKNKKKLFVFISLLLGLYENLHWHASTEIERKEILSTIKKTKSILVLKNLVKFDEVKRENYLKEKNSLRVIFISRIHKTKNLKYALELFSNIKANIIFDIYGLIEDQNYWERCKSIIAKLPDNIAVSYKGTLPKTKITKTMINYDVFLLPTENENFGQVIFEALSVGLPVIISDRTPWKELTINKAGYDIPLTEKSRFQETIEQFAGMTTEDIKLWQNGSKDFAHKMLAIDILKKRYIQMFNTVINSN